MGVATVTQRVVHVKDVKFDAVLHRRRRINYLTVATSQSRSASFIKVSGRVRSEKFKRLGFSFTVIVLALKQVDSSLSKNQALIS